MYNVFHISYLRKYIWDPNHAIITELLELTVDLAYEKRPIQIIDHRVKHLQNKQIPLVKVLWTNDTSLEATWEIKEDIKAKYLHLLR